MKIYQVILEYNSDSTQQKWGDRIYASAQNDGTIINFTPEKDLPQEKQIRDHVKLITLRHLLLQFEDSDPTPTNKYVHWIAKMYAKQNGKLKIEDVTSVMSDDLEKFSKLVHTKKIPVEMRDINRYNTPDDLYSAVEKYSHNLDKEIENKGKYEDYLNNSQVRIIIPKDEQAAKFWGQGTRWCTSSKKNHRTFKEYGAGTRYAPLFIIIPKQPAYPGEKYQVQGETHITHQGHHHREETIKNEKDVELNRDQIINLQKRLKLNDALDKKQLLKDFDFYYNQKHPDEKFKSENHNDYPYQTSEIPEWFTMSPKELEDAYKYTDNRNDDTDDYSDDEYDDIEYKLRSQKSKMRKRRE